MVPGQQYRIIDYNTTTAQEDTSSAGHQFDIIVTADDSSTLNENARAILHSGDDDDYFSNSDLNSWELKYCIDNDVDRFGWADEDNGKGVIYYMKDEWGNECPYDFKNIMFTRYKLGDATIDDESSAPDWCISKKNMLNAYLTGPNPTPSYVWTGTSTDDHSWEEVEGIVYSSYSDETKEFYTFSNFILDVVSDKSLTNNCNNNVIKGYNTSNNIFIYTSISNGCFSNTFGTDCFSNTFGDSCSSNTFGDSCGSNTFGTDCFSNTFGTGCGSNTFGNRCRSNTFGDNCESNTFGDNCSSNTFGTYCSSNTFGDNCSPNTFGDSCSSNTFGNRCNYNTFGTYCSSNTFGNNCTNNTFGNGCTDNTFGNYCSYNTFGTDCDYNTFGNSCNSNTFGTGGDHNTFGDNCESNTFGTGCGSSTFGISCNSNTFGTYCGYNTFGNSCYYNTFGNNCNYSTFGNRCSSNTFGDNCESNTFGISGSPKSYCRYFIIENGNNFLHINPLATTAGSSYAQNIIIKQGVNNTSADVQVDIPATVVNQSYQWTIAKDSARNIRQYCLEDKLTF